MAADEGISKHDLNRNLQQNSPPAALTAPMGSQAQGTPVDNFADAEGLPAEITSILKRGGFPRLDDDECAKLGAFLSASSPQRTRFSELLTPEGKKKHERMTEAMNRLQTIHEYNTTLRRSVAPPSVQAETPSSATPQWRLRPFDPTCKELATAAHCAYLRNVYWSIRPEWDGVNLTAIKSTLLNHYKSWTPDHLVGLTVWEIGQLLAGAPKKITVELRGEPPTAAFQNQVLKFDDEGTGSWEVPWNPDDRNYIPGAEAVQYVVERTGLTDFDFRKLATLPVHYMLNPAKPKGPKSITRQVHKGELDAWCKGNVTGQAQQHTKPPQSDSDEAAYSEGYASGREDGYTRGYESVKNRERDNNTPPRRDDPGDPLEHGYYDGWKKGYEEGRKDSSQGRPHRA